MRTIKIILLPTAQLRPHPENSKLYGDPKDNSAYGDILASMKAGGFLDRFPLCVTSDNRILHGVTRWACAKKAGIEEVPCEVFQPEDPATAELEIERAIVVGNRYRVKTQMMIAREQRKALEIETELARRRMGAGSDGGFSKSTDRVGKIFGESGKTVQRRQKILRAIEEAQSKQPRKAERLIQLLESRQTLKALEAIDGKTAPPKPAKKIDVPPTLHAHANKAYSEFYEACCKAGVPAELEILDRTIGRMTADLNTARKRLGVIPCGQAALSPSHETKKKTK
jgi:ParB-like chromosome segregation protein Spo0J